MSEIFNNQPITDVIKENARILFVNENEGYSLLNLDDDIYAEFMVGTSLFFGNYIVPLDNVDITGKGQISFINTHLDNPNIPNFLEYIGVGNTFGFNFQEKGTTYSMNLGVNSSDVDLDIFKTSSGENVVDLEINRHFI